MCNPPLAAAVTVGCDRPTPASIPGSGVSTSVDVSVASDRDKNRRRHPPDMFCYAFLTAEFKPPLVIWKNFSFVPKVGPEIRSRDRDCAMASEVCGV
jgi:hypothetical protein